MIPCQHPQICGVTQHLPGSAAARNCGPGGAVSAARMADLGTPPAAAAEEEPRQWNGEELEEALRTSESDRAAYARTAMRDMETAIRVDMAPSRGDLVAGNHGGIDWAEAEVFTSPGGDPWGARECGDYLLQDPDRDPHVRALGRHLRGLHDRRSADLLSPYAATYAVSD